MQVMNDMDESTRKHVCTFGGHAPAAAAAAGPSPSTPSGSSSGPGVKMACLAAATLTSSSETTSWSRMAEGREARPVGRSAEALVCGLVTRNPCIAWQPWLLHSRSSPPRPPTRCEAGA